MKIHIHYTIVFLFLVFIGLSLRAQDAKPLKITDPGEIYSTYNFSAGDQQVIIQAAGKEKFDAINSACREDQWPEGIATLDQRLDHREDIKNYVIRVIVPFGEKSILEISAANNPHMPAEMLSAVPFYFVIGSGGVGTGEEMLTGQEEARDFLDFPMVQILDPGAILPDYEFSSEEIQNLVELVGQEGYDFIRSNSRQNVWPEAVNTAEKRTANSEDITYYMAFLVAEIGDICILEITPEENLLMKDEFIPDNVIYFVIRSEGIEVLE